MRRIVDLADGYESESAPPIAGIAAFAVFNYTLTALDISNGYISLVQAPTSASETLFFWQNIAQIYGTDFDVTGLQLNFLPALTPEIQDGDKVIIIIK